MGKIRVRWPDGNICGTCFHDATRTFGSCSGCGRERLLPGRDGMRPLCRDRRGLCTRCTLRDDLTALLLPAGRDREPGLERLVDVLVNVDRPESIHTWKHNPKTRLLLQQLGSGDVALSHDGLDALPYNLRREHIRQLLMHHGLLPTRNSDIARFEAWLENRLSSIEDPAIRNPLEQFATWHHLRRIRARHGRGAEVSGAVDTSKQEITEVGRFLSWLAGRDKTIATCQQADLEAWLCEGPTTRHAIRTFIIWVKRHKLCGDLEIGYREARSQRLITQDDRLEMLARCLAGDHDTLPYRVAAVLLLLYAQPLVRIARLRTEHITVAPYEIGIKFGKSPAPVPEPFAQLLREYLSARPNLRTGNSGDSECLFPSTRAGRHLDPQTIMHRVRRSGVDLLGSRNAALRELVRQVPPPIVATQLGYSHQVTIRHAELAAEPMSRYAAEKAAQRRRGPGKT
jgi:hypothetical protein